MRHPEGPRAERRRRARLEALADAMTPKLPKHLRSKKRPYGVDLTQEQLSERERVFNKFGPQVEEREVDRRQSDRRKMAMSEKEVDDWLKMNGISGGDRRHNDRRQGDRRR